MDLVISFDYKDAENNDLIYHPLVYSDISDTIPAAEQSDVYFCGAAKNRLDEIVETFHYLSENGVKCNFHVIVDKPQNYKSVNGLSFCKSLSYFDNLQHVKSCKYILEIMQHGGTGYTIRTCEAIAFNKRIISNNQYLNKADFYDEANFILFHKTTDIDCTLILNPDKATTYQYIDQINPYAFMEFIDKKLEILDNK